MIAMSDFGHLFVNSVRIARAQAIGAPNSRGNIAFMATECIALQLCLFRKLLVAAVSLAGTSLAQTPLPPSPFSQLPASTSAAALPVFEVAVIKLNLSGSGSSRSNIDNGRFNATNVSLKNLMEYRAYGIPGSRILSGPKWLDSTRFDIEAKMDDAGADRLRTLAHNPRKLEMQAMFQQLLAERFKLAVHWETRELPVYALIVAKKSPKLPPTKESTEGSGTSSHNTGSGSQFSARGVTLPEFAEALTQELSRELGRGVIDKTEIKGRYDITLKWTPDGGASADSAAPSTDSGPSIFTAIQEELGLKLKPEKASVHVLVIDHAEMPSEN
jgi:uncharacterized protein (TIGR03435 family)